MATTTSVYVDPNTGGVQAGLMQFRNAIINGDMRINQRGASTNLASMSVVGATIGYVVDRWCVLRSGYATDSQMAQGTNIGVLDLPFTEAGITTFSRASRIVSTSSTAAINFSYGLESQDSKKFAGKTVTLSFYYRTGANFSSSALNAYIVTGKGNDEGLQRGSSITGYQANTASFTVNLNWSRAKYTVTITDTAVTQIGVSFQLIPSGTALAADYFDITGVQLEQGSVATPFEIRPLSVELQLCYRYYYRIGTTLGNFNTIVASGHMRDTISCDAMVTLPCVMRKMPTGGKGTTELIIYAGNGNPFTTGAYNINVSLNNNSIWVRFNAGTAQTMGYGAIVVTNGQNSYMDFNAEL
jgi:hypothetical protein